MIAIMAADDCERLQVVPVTGVHSRPGGIPRPVAAATHGCWQAQERTGITVAEVSAALRRCWETAADGRAFAVATHLAGLRLARGRRGIVAVDPMGTPHALPRRLGLTAADVRRKLADLDTAALPTVEDTQTAVKRHTNPGKITMPNTIACTARRLRRRRAPDEPPQPLTPDYWRRLGYEVEPLPGALMVTLPGGTRLEDRGDAMVLHRSGDPTPEETRLLVAAAKARGWDAIHFSGGSPEWQRQARLEALKQGFPLAAISLACEDTAPPATATAMPRHIRRRLLPEPPEDTPAPLPDVPAPAAETPVLGYRP